MTGSDETIQLSSLELYLDADAGTVLTWQVFEGAAHPGTMTEIASVATTVAPGDAGSFQFHSSGPLSATLTAGMYYGLGVHWATSTGYTFTSSSLTIPLPAPFGTMVDGANINSIASPVTSGDMTGGFGAYTAQYEINVHWLGEEDYDGDGELICTDCDDADIDNFNGNFETCDDVLDNDCDEDADCDDVDCFGDSACPSLYAVDGSDAFSGNLYEIDPLDATTVTVGAVGYALSGLAFAPDGTLYGSEGQAFGGAPGRLVTIDPDTGVGSLVGSYGVSGVGVPDLTFVGSTLYGWVEDDDDAATIDTTTGAISLLGNSALNTAGSGFAADSTGTLWFTAQGNNLYTIDPVTGAATLEVALAGLTFDTICALTWLDGVLFGIDRDYNAGSNLISIDTTTGAVTTIGALPTNADGLASTIP